MLEWFFDYSGLSSMSLTLVLCQEVFFHNISEIKHV